MPSADDRPESIKSRRVVTPFRWRAVPKARSLLLQLFLSRYRDRGGPYYSDPSRGLHGDWPCSRRGRGLESIVSAAVGMTVLDLGCAEGLVSELFLQAGAAYVHGIDRRAGRIDAARRLFGDCPNARFDVADIGKWRRFQRHAGCLPRYDLVVMLGVYQKLPAHSRDAALRCAVDLSG